MRLIPRLRGIFAATTGGMPGFELLGEHVDGDVAFIWWEAGELPGGTRTVNRADVPGSPLARDTLDVRPDSRQCPAHFVRPPCRRTNVAWCWISVVVRLKSSSAKDQRLSRWSPSALAPCRKA